MAVDRPAEDPLSIPAGAVSYCSGMTGDCWWLRRANDQPTEPGQVARLEMGDTAGSFRVIVAPHEVEQLATAWLKTIFQQYGYAGVDAIVDYTEETMDPEIFGLIEEDTRRSSKAKNITGWRDTLPASAR